MASRSTSPSPGQSGQDDREERDDVSVESDSEAVAQGSLNRADAEPDAIEIESGGGGDVELNRVSGSQVSSGIRLLEAQPGSSSSSVNIPVVSEGGSVSGSFQVAMMLADDDDDDDMNEDDEVSRAIAESRHTFAASSSSSAARSNVSNAVAEGGHSNNFSPQPSTSAGVHQSAYLTSNNGNSSSSSSAIGSGSGGSNNVTAGISTTQASSNAMSTSSSSSSSISRGLVPSTSSTAQHPHPSSGSSRGFVPIPTTSRGISSSSSGVNNLSSSADKVSSHNAPSSNVQYAPKQSLDSGHGEISNPPSPLGGNRAPLAASDQSNNSRPDSPQAGPSGTKRSANANVSGSNSALKRRRDSFDPVQPGPSNVGRNYPASASFSTGSFAAAAAAALSRNQPHQHQQRQQPQIVPRPHRSSSAQAPMASASASVSGGGGGGPFVSRSQQNITSSEAVAAPRSPIDGGFDLDDDDESPGPASPIIPPHTPADNYLISSSTGVVNDGSVPPTPVDVHGDISNDLSVPSPYPNSPAVNSRGGGGGGSGNDVDDMIDSTVDSTVYAGGANNDLLMDPRLDNTEVEVNGPVQSSHYEDSSDDEDEREAAAVAVARQLSRQQSSNVEGISTSGQVDDGNFRLVPNNPEDDQFNQFNPPRSSEAAQNLNAALNNEPIPGPSNYNPPAGSGSGTRKGASNSHNSGSSVKPVPSRKMDSTTDSNAVNVAACSNTGSNGNGNGNGLDGYDFAALGNYADPTAGDFQLSSSFPPLDSHPVDLEDIQVQNLVPDESNEANASPKQIPVPINSNESPPAMPPLGNIGMAFSAIPGFSKNASSSSSTSSQQPIEVEIPTSQAQQNQSNSSSLPSMNLTSMTGPLSKRLRTLHSLQQQQSTPANEVAGESMKVAAGSATSPKNNNTKEFKVNGKGKKSSPPPGAPGEAAAASSASASTSKRYDNDDDGGAGGPPSSSLALGGTQHTYSVTIENNMSIQHAAIIKPKKFFQQKSAADFHSGDLGHKQQSEEGLVPSLLEDVINPFNESKSIEKSKTTSNSLALNRGRRKKKPKTMSQWCDQCHTYYNSDCPLHQPPVMMQITDSPVMSRAQASLPSGYLTLKRVPNSDGEQGVHAKKTIPKACRFGPVEGREVRPDVNSQSRILLIVQRPDGTNVQLDLSSSEESNWMRFVRPATRYAEQNLILHQEDNKLYYTTTRPVQPRQELRVWYSPVYAEARGLPILEPTEDDYQALNEDENPWPCFECSHRFSNSVELQRHLNEHENIPPNNSSTSGGRRGRRVSGVRKQKKAKIHLPKEGESGNESNASPGGGGGKTRYKCHICPRNFDRHYSLNRHVALHKGDKKFKCDECSAKFSLEFNLSRHMRRVHYAADSRSNYMRCKVCALWFDSELHYQVHLFSHRHEQRPQVESVAASEEEPLPEALKSHLNEDASLVCHQCNIEFKHWRDLSLHSASHGVQELPRPQPVLQGDQQHAEGFVADDSASGPGSRSFSLRQSNRNNSKPHKCELCYKSFSTEDRLKKHMAVHGSDESKPLSCDECGKRFLSNSALACHIKVHSSQNNSYDCPICNAPFEQIHTLKEHVHVHRENNVYTCPHCSKVFPEYAHIRKHIRAFHAKKRFHCQFCEKSFTGSDKLKAHLVKHSDKREFLCNECGKQFKRKDKLKEHAKRMHLGEKKPAVPVKRECEKFIPRVSPTDYHRFIYKCHKCLLGFKRRGMLVNHLAKRHPDIALETVPELNLPILKATKDYFCQYCHKVYKSSSKRKAHILKNHPGMKPPPSARDKEALASNQQEVSNPEAAFNPTFSATVGSVTSQPHNCPHCHKQYASNAKLLQHLRKQHSGEELEEDNKPRDLNDLRAPVQVQQQQQQQQQLQLNPSSALKLVTVTGDELSQLIQQKHHSNFDEVHWRQVEASEAEIISAAGMQPMPQPQVPSAARSSSSSTTSGAPGDLEYRTVDGEVLQLTRVPQDEAMRLVNSGATVIHVPAESPRGGGASMDPVPGSSNRVYSYPQQQQQEQSRPQQHHSAPQIIPVARGGVGDGGSAAQAPNPAYDLQHELVQALVSSQQQQQQQATPHLQLYQNNPAQNQVRSSSTVSRATSNRARNANYYDQKRN